MAHALAQPNGPPLVEVHVEPPLIHELQSLHVRLDNRRVVEGQLLGPHLAWRHACVRGDGGAHISAVEDQGSGTKDQGSGIRDQGSGIRDQGSRIRDQGSGIRGQGSGIRDLGCQGSRNGPPLPTHSPHTPHTLPTGDPHPFTPANPNPNIAYLLHYHTCGAGPCTICTSSQRHVGISGSSVMVWCSGGISHGGARDISHGMVQGHYV